MGVYKLRSNSCHKRTKSARGINGNNFSRFLHNRERTTDHIFHHSWFTDTDSEDTFNHRKEENMLRGGSTVIGQK